MVVMVLIPEFIDQIGCVITLQERMIFHYSFEKRHGSLDVTDGALNIADENGQ